MAAEADPVGAGPNGKKKKTKFGMMMNGMSRSARKNMARAGQQMKKGAVKAKQAAVEKIAKVPTSDEDPEIVSALERLKITKTEIYAISDIARNLYESRLNEATFLIQLSEKLKETKVTQNDPFTSYVQSMGVGLASLEQVQAEHLKKMEEELVVPLEQFRDIDVENVQKLKLKYKNGKTQFDIAAHKLVKAQESQDAAKIQTAQEKKDSVYTQLTQLRNDFKFQINNLEQKKQVNLLQNMETYWASYAAFASAQSSILSKHDIQKQNYTGYVAPVVAAPAQTEPTAPTDDIMNSGYEAKDESGQAAYANGGSIMDQEPAQQGAGSNGMPAPPATGGDDDYEYEEYEEDGTEYAQEKDNGPTDDYNPFE